MTIYRVHLLGPDGSVAAAQQFSAASRGAAVRIARGMTKEDSLFTGFELWSGTRRVHVETQENARALDRYTR